ncbi:MAG: isoprenyl transferase [Proteobacteria bacterium]|nr:isoprenyl transferase [Pseudomonadota bacterium]MBU4472490.1 isoprenyl transferase [Pseudomonadota bacterium]
MTCIKIKRKKSLNFKNESKIPDGLDPDKIPMHVGIIMDGNGRWAKKRKLNRINGHNRGAETVRTVVRSAREMGISFLTLYAFSTENWERPKTEVMALMKLLKRFLVEEQNELLENNIRLNAIGQIHRLPKDVTQVLDYALELTAKNSGMVLTLALSYGGRSEIAMAAAKIAEDAVRHKIQLEEITPELLSKYLYTHGMPDPDLVIRTSGEMRISNFLLWQIAYSEIYFTHTLWPDLDKAEFHAIIKDYQLRQRRFGKIPSE